MRSVQSENEMTEQNEFHAHTETVLETKILQFSKIAS